jgi:hypothetical protein
LDNFFHIIKIIMTRNAGVGYDIGFLLVYFLIERIVLFSKKIASIFLLY